MSDCIDAAVLHIVYKSMNMVDCRRLTLETEILELYWEQSIERTHCCSIGMLQG